MATDHLGPSIDVSSAQGSVDWHQVHQAGIKVAFAKATEGATYNDPTFTKARLVAMENAGLRRGAYHFARPANNKPAAEVAHFLKVVKGAGGKLIGYPGWKQGKAGMIGVLDFESAPYDPAWAKEWALGYHDKVGHRPGIYGGGYSLNPIVSVLDHFSFIWIAAYVKDWKPYFNGPDERVAFHQFTDKGTCPGVNGNVDRSVYLG